MQAVLMPGDSRIEIVEVPIPDPGPGEVLLKTAASGLCGSDLHMQYQPPADQRRGIVYGLQTNPDIVPGHEPAGVVAAVGPGGSHLSVGDRVAVHHMGGCGTCLQCRRGWDINCQSRWGVYGLDKDGAMQDFMVVRSRDCVLVPDAITLREACYFACGAGTGYLALKRGAFTIGETVAVVGLGPVGLAAAFFAARAGAQVFGFDTIAERNGFAEGLLGNITALDPTDGDVLDALMTSTGGRGADVVIEASGKSAGRELALDVLAMHGRVVCVGFSDEVSPLRVQQGIIQKQADLRGAWMFPIQHLQSMLNSCAEEGVSITPLIQQSYPLERSEAAWREFEAGSLGKTVISWDL